MKLVKNTRREFVKQSAILSGGIFFSNRVTADINTSVLAEDDKKRLRSLLSDKEPLIWLFTGDSITQGAVHTHGMRSYDQIAAERIRYELNRRRDIVINTAISGHRTTEILADVQWRIRQFNPDVVSLMFGTNDCAQSIQVSPDVFKQNMNSLVDAVRNMNAIPVLHTPSVIILEESPERNTIESYVEMIREVASSGQVILIDHWEYWRKTMSERGNTWIFSNWLDDRLHPNGTGHRQMAQLFFREIGIFDPKAPTCV